LGKLRARILIKKAACFPSGSYLDGRRFDEADAVDVLHDLREKLEGLQEGATGIGDVALLPLLLQVVNEDVVVLLPVGNDVDER